MSSMIFFYSTASEYIICTIALPLEHSSISEWDIQPRIGHYNPTDEDFMFKKVATIDRLEENIQRWYVSSDVCDTNAIIESDY